MAKEASCGLLHLHSEGIIHRDIATRNMLVSSDLTIVVTDFGLSRLFDNEEIEIRTNTN